MKQMMAIAILSLTSTMSLVRPPADVYAVNVTIRPESPANPYELLAPARAIVTAHVYSVEVIELVTNTTIVGPKLVLMPGDHATKANTISGVHIELTASLTHDAQRASWEVVLSREGQI